MDNQQVEDIVKCSDCGSRSLTRDETRGEVVCDDCGLVLEDNVIDQGAEWRVFSPEQGDQRARTCLLYTSPSPRDVEESRMPSSA